MTNRSPASGDSVDLYGLGENIEVTVPGGQTMRGQGTSYASPFVVHAAAAMLAANPALSPAELDGLLIAASSSLRVPTAYSTIFERVGDLTGDRIGDNARATALMERPEFVEDPALLPVVRGHLLRDFGPEAAARGGEMMLTASLTPRLAQIMALIARTPVDMGPRQAPG